MDVIDMMFELFSDEIDNISLNSDLIGDDEMWDMCDNTQAESEDKEYEAEVITRGNCMMCGKELTEGLFFCKECEVKVIQSRKRG